MRNREAFREKRRRERDRWYNGGVLRVESYREVKVPDDVQRVTIHEPCTYCGTARGACKHRGWA